MRNNFLHFTIVVLLLTFIPMSKAEKKLSSTDAFELEYHPSKILVNSPDHFSSKFAVIIMNKTNKNLMGKIVQFGEKKIQKFLTIYALESHSIELSIEEGDRVFFVANAPSFQEIELKFGNKSYEIPDPVQTK